MRYQVIGREVWDKAWSDPATGTWTSGLTREQVVTRYPSVQAAYEAAESLNESRGARLYAYRVACEAAVAENERELPQPRADWLDGIDIESL